MAQQSRYPQRPILLVDDEPSWAHSMALSLKISAAINHVVLCQDSREALDLLAAHDCCLVLLDLTMPYVSGETLLEQLTEKRPDIPVIIISGMNQIETAIRCVKAGARDFYVKTDERERVVSGIVRVLKQLQLEEENRRLTRSLLEEDEQGDAVFAPIITRSPKMRAIFAYLRAIAQSDEPILIKGESGVGKELVAQALHQLRCPQKPWVAVNVAGLDDMMFSDTLFGHRPGAFTGADQIRRGMLEKAGEGVLFLDEIGDLSPASQVKLLRLLQDGEYYPLGSDQAGKSRACILAATNQDLSVKVREESFRRDLHYRLCAHQVIIPPLRERAEDLPLLLEHFLREAAEQFGCKVPSVPQELLRLLTQYSFPGNVRELRAMVFDAVSLQQGSQLSLDRFREAIGRDTDTERAISTAQADQMQFPFVLPTLKEVNQLLVDEALKRSCGNRSAAARMIGVSPQALSKRLKKSQNPP